MREMESVNDNILRRAVDDRLYLFLKMRQRNVDISIINDRHQRVVFRKYYRIV